MSLNKKQRIGTIAAVTFAATLVATLALVPLTEQAFARPAPQFDVGSHVMKINLIGVPNDTDRNCDKVGGNNNIYTRYDTDDPSKTIDKIPHSHIFWQLAASNKVIDHCTEGVGILDNPAIVDIVDGEYIVSVRILGPANDVDKNFLRICSETKTEHDTLTHCIIDEDLQIEDVDIVKRNAGKPEMTKLSKNLFNDAGEDSVWSYTAGERFRIAQVDIWELP